MSLIIIAAIVGGYCSYQQFNNQQTTQSHEQLDDVKIQASNNNVACTQDSDCASSYCDPSTLTCQADTQDGQACTSNCDCISGNCYAQTCAGCGHTATPCANDGQCCDSNCVIPEGLTTGTCGVNAIETDIEYIVGAVAATGLFAGAADALMSSSDDAYQKYEYMTPEEYDQAYAAHLARTRVNNAGSNKVGPKGGQAGNDRNNLFSNDHGRGQNNLGANKTDPIGKIDKVVETAVKETAKTSIEDGAV